MKPKWEDCICHTGNVHTQECKRNHKDNIYKNLILRRKEKRHKLRKEGRCIHCGIKVKPIIVIPQHCEKHKQK